MLTITSTEKRQDEPHDDEHDDLRLERDQMPESLWRARFACDQHEDLPSPASMYARLSVKSATASNTILAMRSGDFEQQTWTVPRLVPDHSLAIMYGGSGAGKSWCACHLALTVAAGGSFAGERAYREPVIFVATEDFAGIRRRLAALAIANDAEAAASNILVVPGPLDLSRQDHVRALAEVANDFSDTVGAVLPGLIVVDHLSSSFLLDQDRGADASLLMNNLQALIELSGASTLLLHHSGHNGERMRGSTVLRDRADVRLSVSRRGPMTAGEIEITVEKMRNAPEGERFAFSTAAREISIGETHATAIMLTPKPAEPADAPSIATDEAAAPKLADRVFDMLADLAGPTGETTFAAAKAGMQTLVPEAKPDSFRRMLTKYLTRLERDGRVHRDRDRIMVARPDGPAGPDRTRPPIGGERSVVRGPGSVPSRTARKNRSGPVRESGPDRETINRV